MSGLLRAAARRATAFALRRVVITTFLAAVAPPCMGVAHAAGDATHGAAVYKTCGICHSFDRNGAGPKHAGVFGRTAGTVPDFRYSPALAKSGIVWSEATLDTWLTDPQALVPGSKMFFAVDSARDRADVIAYLKEKGGVAP